MSILITGTSGFIGGSFAHSIPIEERTNYISVGRTQTDIPNLKHYLVDLTDSKLVKDFFSKNYISKIFHFAANSKVNTDNEDLIKSNIYATHNLLLHCPDKIKFIFASSIIVYGNCKMQMYEDMPCEPCSVYGTTKLTCENLLSCYSILKDIDYLCIRLGATIGSNAKKGLIPDILRKLKNPELELLNEFPGPFKPYTHIDEVINAIKFLDNKNNLNNKIFNVCNDDVISVYDVALNIMKTLNIKKNIVWLNKNWKGDNNKLWCSNNLLEEVGFTFKLNSKNAIIEAVKNVNI